MLSIRPILLDHLDALLALYRDLHPNDAPLSPQRAHTIWDRIMHDPAQIYLGGFIGTDLVSACNATIIPNLTRGGHPYAVIENVVTAAAHRNQGHGSALLRALVDRCWSHDCYKIMLMSATARTEAHHFYEAIGFDTTSKQAFVMTRK